MLEVDSLGHSPGPDVTSTTTGPRTRTDTVFDCLATPGRAMLEVRNLTKRYGDRVAVDGISFDVAQGQTVGLLGPNGAGKTTTLAMITGLTPPDAGTISAGGSSLAADPD